MKRLLEFLLTGCFHNWETIKEEDWSTEGVTFYKGKEYPIKETFTKYTLRCKKCGEIKMVRN